MKAKQPQVRFVEEGHRYFAGGTEFASVSSVLQKASLVDTTFMHPDAAARGTAIHHSIAMAINNEDDPHYHTWEPYVSAAFQFLKLSGIQVLHVEQIVADYTRGIAGTADVIGKRPDGKLIVVDWKTGGVHSWYGVQVAAYKNMAMCQEGVIVQLTDKGKFKLIDKYKQKSLNWVYWDHVWQAAADLEHFRRSIRGR